MTTHIKNKVLAAVLAVAMLVAYMPMISSSAYATDANGDYVITLDNNQSGDSHATTTNIVASTTNTYDIPTTTTFTAPTGKKFAGWATTTDGPLVVGSLTDINADTTLYASWTDAHVHSWVYATTTDANVVEAYCNGQVATSDCAHYGSANAIKLTLEASASTSYTGSPVKASWKNESSWTDAGCETPSITYYVNKELTTKTDATNSDAASIGAAPKRVGTYYAVGSVGTNSNIVKAVTSFTITKAEVVVPTQTNAFTYDKTEKSSVKAFETSDLYTITTVTATNAGSYTAKAQLKDTNNYVWKLTTPTNTDQTVTWTIKQAPLTVTGSKVASKVYDATTTNATVTVGTVTGIKYVRTLTATDTDAVTVGVASATYNTKNVGTNTVVVKYSLSGADAKNYVTPTDDTLAGVITPKAITVKADNKASLVGEPIAALTYTYDALCGTDKLVATLTTLASPSEATVTSIDKKEIAISDGNKGANYTVTYVPGTYTVGSSATKFVASGHAYKKSIAYTWNKVSGAAKYKVYFKKYGSKYSFKCYKTTIGTSYTKFFLKKSTKYVAKVVAYDANGNKLATTPYVYNRTTGSKYVDATGVTVTAKEVSLKVNGTAKIGAKLTKKLGKKLAFSGIRYYSTDSTVVDYDDDGNILGLKVGVAKIYVVAPNGLATVVTVSVNN